MSNLYSCFAEVAGLVRNGSNSPIGELTNKTKTYAKEPDFYFKKDSPVLLVGFRGVKLDSPENRYEQIPTSHQDPVLTMLDWLYNEAKKGNITDDSNICLQALKTNFSKGWVWKSVGEMVTNSTIWLPSSINFTYEAGGVVHEFKIWMANAAFALEFPYREIYVVGPIPPGDIDYLAEHNYKEVQNRLYEETTDKVQDRVDALVGKTDPYTLRTTYTFNVYDLINKPKFNKAVWTVIYYGNPNDAEEETFEAIRNCILSNSKHPETKWEEVIPDLFNPLEFIAIPHWNELALLNETQKGSTLSPIFTFQGGDALAKKYADFYAEDDIIKSLQIVPSLYKSAAVSFVGKPRNNQGRIHIRQVFPDYQLIPSDDSQAGYMSKETHQFVFDLESMLAAAEVNRPTDLPPAGMQRVTIGGRMYLTKRSSVAKITMATRYQFIKDGLVDDE
ncbi:virion structural protein [Aeromonas phage D3]|uniref:Virion structural protein n=1 Tax=Aeromonas phage D3 TaxID=2593327 RepID=A0A514TV91_9CAUD|nr:virion structural protein [Aeromonas phage D3]QDJ96946.1 hypothetical protein D3_0216 [Aeromonas phage D3]